LLYEYNSYGCRELAELPRSFAGSNVKSRRESPCGLIVNEEPVSISKQNNRRGTIGTIRSGKTIRRYESPERRRYVGSVGSEWT
jgi:hypothetical protein